MQYLIFFIPERHLYISSFQDERVIDVPGDKTDWQEGRGLIGWCIKNKKNVIKKRGVESEKSFIFSPDENVRIDNFLAIPLYKKDISEVGAIGFIKEAIDEEDKLAESFYWEKKEVDILEKIAMKIFKNIVKKQNEKK